ncbi:2-oxoglutarate dehydrogenase E1 component [Caldibacillus thermoamylovorans]|uniref:2-oxoglutarate dehydrogenase E1 component n=2 Tax=Caldibacillus thermoamylovorans TaxID=35841 RepID=A0ABD4AAC2_9BACI|nr:2-oxoglutarate dehydrogenase E1 component [Caldibacillus thermoamylovorans]KIO71336.1 2-oxoglutarate dehydrogenase E1 component [Caldibacillus thermoamylovorans]KIO73949.1 2-oxoglutarate dehydrogenase E1 component [Caldibacillus thermoamylovorans]
MACEIIMNRDVDGMISEGNPWHDFLGLNLGYLIEQYDLYLENPDQVEESLKELFAKWGEPQVEETSVTGTAISTELSPTYVLNKMKKLVQVMKLAENIRLYGHLEADIYPLEKQEKQEILTLAYYGLTESDVREIPADIICPNLKGNFSDGLSAIQYLKNVYTGKIGFEFQHLDDEKEKDWLKNKIENQFGSKKFPVERKINLFESLVAAESFEQFIHKMYVGQKRFSVEGLETLVPALDEFVQLAGENNIENVMIAMAHRGRLNVLAHVLGKPYEALLSQFQHSKWENYDPDFFETVGHTLDVKYHLGAVRNRKLGNKTVKVTLANNPSHLEFVDAVVEGYTRAAQDDRFKKGAPKQDVNKALPIVVHGDSAFAGQGIVYEVFNFAGTEAYHTGGTIHIIANNIIGFTTEGHEYRSTRYSSDSAKGYHVPIFHVNADDPEASLLVMQLAFEYRQTFHKDVLIDLIGYRRLGHNELDEPMATNPVLYNKIKAHPTITEVYKKKLLDEKIFTVEKAKEMETAAWNKLKQANDRIDKQVKEVPTIAELQKGAVKEFPSVDTTVDKATLTAINKALLDWPKELKAFKKLERILGRRLEVFEKKGKIDWGHAEALAFATILKDGKPIRLTGEDSERGTFSHRNAVLTDVETGEKYIPLQHLDVANASFAIHNSTLSEAGILGFEYGYSVIAPETLVLWEAQFGDFANGAQVIIDQFISAGKAKWGESSGLVMLLPHGYEGQGPEHSSARLERYLQLAAENNWTVANLSNSAQYFHILRRQAALLKTEYIRPLIIMTPKSLLRNPSASSYVEEFTNGGFQPIIEEPGLGIEPEKVERVIFCTGRLAVELSEHLKEPEKYKWLDIIRVEELYPFPEKQINNILRKYKNLKEVVWAQDEPKNMGAWSYMQPRLQELVPKGLPVSYIGRPFMASPSEGDPLVHKKEQERIIREAITLDAILSTK